MRRLIFAAALLLPVGVASLAGAAGADDPGREEVTSHYWQYALGHTLYGGSGPQMSMLEVKAARKDKIGNDFGLATTATYSRLHPGEGDLPEDLHLFSLNVGADYRVNDRLSVVCFATPGVAGDFHRIAGEDVFLRLGCSSKLMQSERLTISGGLVYTYGVRSFPVFPLLGVTYRPDQFWTFNLGAPRSGIAYSPDATASIYAGAEMAGGEYHLHRPEYQAHVVRYRDFRLTAGAEKTILGAVKLDLSGGYAFGRQFTFYDSSRNDISPSPAPFVRMGVSIAW